ncbi:Ser/Thr protein kinase [Mycobacterium bohemicum DSM 44277]|uniref:non-specific serine/threonine protein kinase n=2 Tax=Mycobacterium bohemicum TaxID=56425 RepID=A0A0U0W7G9_MYCBE|nr:serine/threonine-protein kinase PknH/PknJ [Mycobacterium bohemicum]MCV6968818.1 sensor domain-containing protein [Mycobacterium bohemicum]CPR09821.1 Ser/Thr protein kinase [Mycobacterium bohemicum DSM 44277]
MSDAQASRVGSTFGPYRLTRLLGRGGMGEVYEAEHTVKEWTVAVKLMTAEFSKDPVFRERMKREARIAGRLQEPHVVPIHDYGEIDGQMFLEMRLIEGTDLDSLLKRYGPLTPPRAVAIITQIASALDAAHAAGVMHRDVKPPNILVTRDDFAYLVDFGIASATTDEKLTQLGTAVGTWKYMAPERFSNAEVTYRADIYALACVLYECLTGAPPYRADSAASLVTAHLMDAIPQPSTQHAGVPKGFDAVIARGMAKKPEDRYASAGDLALAAHEALTDPDQNHAETILRRSQEATLPTIDTTPATPEPRTPPAAPAPYPPGPLPGDWVTPPPNTPVPQQFPGPALNPARKRNPWPLVATVAVVLVVVVSGIGIWLVVRPKPAPPPDPVSTDQLSALLLSTSDINSIMGASTMEAGKPITAMNTSELTLSAPDCQGALYTSQDPVYAGSGYTGISALVSSEPGDNYTHWANQAVVAFPSADKAKAFLQSSATTWKDCAGKTIEVTKNGDTIHWTFGELSGAPPKIAMADSEEGADGWGCQRVLGVANNVIVDIRACAYHVGDQAGQIADKIVANVNKL